MGLDEIMHNLFQGSDGHPHLTTNLNGGRCPVLATDGTDGHGEVIDRLLIQSETLTNSGNYELQQQEPQDFSSASAGILSSVQGDRTATTSTTTSLESDPSVPTAVLALTCFENLNNRQKHEPRQNEHGQLQQLLRKDPGKYIALQPHTSKCNGNSDGLVLPNRNNRLGGNHAVDVSSPWLRHDDLTTPTIASATTPTTFPNNILFSHGSGIATDALTIRSGAAGTGDITSNRALPLVPPPPSYAAVEGAVERDDRTMVRQRTNTLSIPGTELTTCTVTEVEGTAATTFAKPTFSFFRTEDELSSSSSLSAEDESSSSDSDCTVDSGIDGPSLSEEQAVSSYLALLRRQAMVRKASTLWHQPPPLQLYGTSEASLNVEAPTITHPTSQSSSVATRHYHSLCLGIDWSVDSRGLVVEDADPRRQERRHRTTKRKHHTDMNNKNDSSRYPFKKIQKSKRKRSSG